MGRRYEKRRPTRIEYVERPASDNSASIMVVMLLTATFVVGLFVMSRVSWDQVLGGKVIVLFPQKSTQAKAQPKPKSVVVEEPQEPIYISAPRVKRRPRLKSVELKDLNTNRSQYSAGSSKRPLQDMYRRAAQPNQVSNPVTKPNRSVSQIHHKMSFESEKEAMRFAREALQIANRLIRDKQYRTLDQAKYLFKQLLLGRETLFVVKGYTTEARILKQQFEDHINEMRAWISTNDWIQGEKQQLLTMDATVLLIGNLEKIEVLTKHGIGRKLKYTFTVVLLNKNRGAVKNIKVRITPFDETKAPMGRVVLNGPESLGANEKGKYSGVIIGADADRVCDFDLDIKVD